MQIKDTILSGVDFVNGIISKFFNFFELVAEKIIFFLYWLNGFDFAIKNIKILEHYRKYIYILISV